MRHVVAEREGDTELGSNTLSRSQLWSWMWLLRAVFEALEGHSTWLLKAVSVMVQWDCWLITRLASYR
jgi:hypothetical protein